MYAKSVTFSAAALVLVLALATPVAAQDAGSARLKDLVNIAGAMPVQLTGYGLVVGLDRTGDRARGRRGAPQTVQSIANMLQRFGIVVDPDQLTSRNTAAVMVTATMDPFTGPGSRLDVTVSALGDARSLSGGVLLQTPLMNAAELNNRAAYAIASGPLSTGAILASNRGSSVQVNHSNTGRIPNGAVVLNSTSVSLADSTSQIGLVLKRPDFTNAVRIAEAINAVYPNASAQAEHAGLVRVDASSLPDGPSAFLAGLEEITIDVDVPARVVINERTGTIVAGGNVRLNQVMVTYGSITISTQTDPFVSQPAPFSQQGETVSGAVGTAAIDEQATRSVVLDSNTDVSQLATALNDLGLTARDVIAIFQAIDRAGALQGSLIIL